MYLALRRFSERQSRLGEVQAHWRRVGIGERNGRLSSAIFNFDETDLCPQDANSFVGSSCLRRTLSSHWNLQGKESICALTLDQATLYSESRLLWTPYSFDKLRDIISCHRPVQF